MLDFGQHETLWNNAKGLILKYEGKSIYVPVLFCFREKDNLKKQNERQRFPIYREKNIKTFM